MTAGGGGKAALQKLAAMKRRRQLEDAPSIDMDRQQRLREKASRVAALMRGISNDFDETWSICREVGAAHDAYEQARFYRSCNGYPVGNGPAHKGGGPAWRRISA